MAEDKPTYMDALIKRAQEIGRDMARPQPKSVHYVRDARSQRIIRQTRTMLPDGREVITEEFIATQETYESEEYWGE